MLAGLLVLAVVIESVMVGALLMIVHEVRRTLVQHANDLESMRLYLVEQGMDDGRND